MSQKLGGAYIGLTIVFVFPLARMKTCVHRASGNTGLQKHIVLIMESKLALDPAAIESLKDV